MKEMAKFAQVNVVCDATNQPALINSHNWVVNKNADFCHIVDDEKSSGVELSEMTWLTSKIDAAQPIVCDMTSSFLSKSIDWTNYGVVYAGAAKHSATGSSCVVVVRRDLIGRQAANTPSMLSWASYMNQSDSFPNTPNTWGVYMMGLHLNYMLVEGGLGEMHARSLARS